jgi:hypothetical protein
MFNLLFTMLLFEFIFKINYDVFYVSSKNIINFIKLKDIDFKSEIFYARDFHFFLILRV